MTDPILFSDDALWPDDGVWDDDALWNDVEYVPGLLPDNATPQEVALDRATGRIGAVPVDVRLLWNPATCPAAILPWLAWALSVDEWQPDWPVERKRAVIASSVEIHRRKGTRAAVVEALRAAGYGDAELIEDYGRQFHDGTFLRDGTRTYVDGDHWAEYRVILARPITLAQGQQVRRILAGIAPLRSHLKAMDFQEVAHTRDGTIRYDGIYSHGVA